MGMGIIMGMAMGIIMGMAMVIKSSRKRKNGIILNLTPKF